MTTPVTLDDLLAGGETLQVEFKRELGDAELVEEAMALANGEGGVLLIGVEDDGSVTGARPRHGDVTDVGRVEALIRNRTEPPLSTWVEVVPFGDQEVVKIAVPIGTTVTATKTGGFKRRVIGPDGKPQTIGMRPDEVVARAASVGQVDLSTSPLRDVTLDDLDPAELNRYRRLAESNADEAGGLSDVDLLRGLRFIDTDNRLTVGALLLFGRPQAIGRWLPNYEAGYQELDALEVRSSRRWNDPIIKVLFALEEWISLRNPEEEVEVGFLRQALPRFTNSAVRELLVNSLVHRDYAGLGASLVEVNEGGIIISNPGGFPAGITIDNLLRTPPRARNPAIADALKRVGLGERTSRGINRAFESQLLAGRPPPTFDRSTSESVVVELSGVEADRELAAFFVERQQAGYGLGLADLLTLHEVRRAGRISTKRAAELFQTEPAVARATLNHLVSAGLLESRGERKGRTYHLASGYYERLRRPGDYQRTKGFTVLQQKELIREYIRDHGRIARADAADLCQLTPEAASALLRSMRDDGELVMVGERRGTRYLLAEQ